MDFTKIRVLLLDTSGRQVPTILRELHELGCHVTTLNSSRLDIGYASRYPDVKLLYPGSSHDLSILKEALDKEIPTGKYDVVMPLLEEATELCWTNYDHYGKHVKVAAADYEGFLKAYDKQLTMKLCQENGIPCPRTKMDDESMDEFLSKVQFPLALKPRNGSGSRGFYKVENRERLDELVQSGKVKVNEYVIQEFVSDAEIHRVSYTFIDNFGDVKASMMAKSSRPYPLGVGTNSFFESTNRPDLCEKAERLLKLMGWHGYASVCFIESENDRKPKVMEINGRISASITISWLCGINVVKMMLERAYGEKVTEYSRDIFSDIRIKHSQAHNMWFLKSPRRFSVKPSFFNRSNTYDVVFSWADPLPYFTYTLQCFAKYKTEMKKRER